MRPHKLHSPLARPHATHARTHMLTGPSVSAIQPNLRLFSRRLWNSEHVIAIVHAHPATSHALNPALTFLVCGVDTKPYKPRPKLLHSTNSLSTYHFRPSPSYSSSSSQHTYLCCLTTSLHRLSPSTLLYSAISFVLDCVHSNRMISSCSNCRFHPFTHSSILTLSVGYWRTINRRSHAEH